MKLLPIILLLALPAALQAQDYTCTTNNGTLTITYYDGPGGVVIIPDTINGLPVTGIGDHAFYDIGSRDNYLRRPVRIPLQLTSITIPNSVTSIGNEAFRSNTALTNVVMGDSVTNLGKRTFSDCYRLSNIKISDSVISIQTQAFATCTSLTSITLPSKVTSIEHGAFDACRNLTAIKIPDSVTNIGDQAFEECFSLTNVIFGNSVAKIGENAFVQCRSLTSLTFPSSLTYIGGSVFGGCDRLTTFYFRGNAPEFSDKWGPGYRGYDSRLVPSATLHYRPGTTGWEAFDGYPTVLWKQ